MEEILLLDNPEINMMNLWGDGRLAKKYGYRLAEGVDINRTPMGAYFCDDCVIKSGKYAGKTLGDLYKEDPDYFGTAEERRWEIMPVNMACMYACESLSIQVHPQEEWAQEHLNAHGKSECWYFADVDAPTYVILGHNARTMEELKAYLDRGDYAGLLRKRPVEKDTFYAIKAGTVHAIQKGCTFIEICNPSPITYRFYDYDRLDKDGKPRQLDTEKALENILVPDDYIDYDPQIRMSQGLKETFLADNRDYSAWKYEVDGEGSLSKQKPFAGGYVIEGCARINGYEVKEGELFFLSSACKEVKIQGKAKILCCNG